MKSLIVDGWVLFWPSVALSDGTDEPLSMITMGAHRRETNTSKYYIAADYL